MDDEIRDLIESKIKSEVELDEYGKQMSRIGDMIDRMNGFLKGLKSKEAINEYRGGFSQRILFINESICKILAIAPPTRKNQLTLEEYCELNINFYAFHLHLFGALENLAWIWFHEKNNDKFIKGDAETVVSLFKEKFVKISRGTIIFINFIKIIKIGTSFLMNIETLRCIVFLWSFLICTEMVRS